MLHMLLAIVGLRPQNDSSLREGTCETLNMVRLQLK